jgi:hypothetical protein
MRRRFILIVPRLNEKTENQLLHFIGGQRLQWWHWFDNAWLIIDLEGKLDAKALGNSLNEIGISDYYVQLVPDNSFWAARLPGEKLRWMSEVWDTK